MLVEFMDGKMNLRKMNDGNLYTMNMFNKFSKKY